MHLLRKVLLRTATACPKSRPSESICDRSDKSGAPTFIDQPSTGAPVGNYTDLHFETPLNLLSHLWQVQHPKQSPTLTESTFPLGKVNSLFLEAR
jgi:hypothetical protein